MSATGRSAVISRLAAGVLALKETVEPILRRVADLAIDTSVPLDEVVEKILAVV